MASTHERQTHWEGVYGSKLPTEFSWFQRMPRVSLELIRAAGIGKKEWIVDVGGGASVLVDHLWGRGFRHLTVLDISSAALDHAKARFGHEAREVEWVAGDVMLFEPPRPYALWHDRAVFHFLTDAAEREAYKKVLDHATTAGSRVVIATFAPDGPETCSGLPVRRYSLEALSAELGESYVFESTVREEHRTPAGKAQAFTYCRFRKL